MFKIQIYFNKNNTQITKNKFKTLKLNDSRLINNKTVNLVLSIKL